MIQQVIFLQYLDQNNEKKMVYFIRVENDIKIEYILTGWPGIICYTCEQWLREVFSGSIKS